MTQIKAIRGMNDVLPETSYLWLYVENICQSVFAAHAYQQIRTPIVESTELFARSIGAETDIVAKEMYTFEDRNGDSLTLRPEGTASCVRAGIENGLFYNQQQRLWYIGPMFRHERPQKGRYRQFYQIGAEAYGWKSSDIDAEIILMSSQIWKHMGIKSPELQINSLGDIQARKKYREALVDYLSQYEAELDEDSRRRLTTNPLRILDSKNQDTQEILDKAPSILDYLDDESKAEFSQLLQYLDALDIKYTVNPRLVRGLDYYNKTVFEWVYKGLGAQATVCAGGRYDGLVEQLGGKPTPAVGFALGMERLIEILKEQKTVTSEQYVDIYIISMGNEARQVALRLSRDLRSNGARVQMHCGDSNIKNQIKRADKSNAKLAIIIGEQELRDNTVILKPLRTDDAQQTISQNDVTKTVHDFLNKL